MTATPKLGQEVAWRYGQGFARGIVVSVGMRRSGPFAIVEWKSRTRTRRINRNISQLIWPGMPYDYHGSGTVKP